MSLSTLLPYCNDLDNAVIVVLTPTTLHLHRNMPHYDKLKEYFNSVKSNGGTKPRYMFRKETNGTIIATIELYRGAYTEEIARREICMYRAEALIRSFSSEEDEIIYQGSCFTL